MTEIPTSFAFSGCGWLIPFHLGVVEVMKQRGLLTTDSFCSGTSGGCIAALAAVLDINPIDVVNIMIALSQKEDILSRVDKELKTSLHSILEKDSYSKCNGKLGVVVTEFDASSAASLSNKSFTGKVISEFESTDQLIDILCASCFLPFYSAMKFSTNINGFDGEYLDGAVRHFIPPVGDVRVCPYPIGIHDDLNIAHITLPISKYNGPRLVFWSLNPPEPKVFHDLFEDGKLAADLYLYRQSSRKSFDFILVYMILILIAFFSSILLCTYLLLSALKYDLLLSN